MRERVTIGIAQYYLKSGAVQENTEAAVGHIRAVVAAGAEVVVIPEMWTIGMDWTNYLENVRSNAEPIPGPSSEVMSSLSRELGIYLAAGSIPERSELGFHNTALFFGPNGKLITTHRKVHLYSPADEHNIFVSGTDFTVFDTPDLGRVGLCVCYDGDFAETARVMALRGADVVFHVNCYEHPCETWWDTFPVYNAMNNAIWWVMSNMVGGYADRDHCFGRSQIISPFGEIVARAPYLPPKHEPYPSYLVQTVEVRDQLERARARLGCILRDRRPDVYGELTKEVVPASVG
jgi:predicted amidohydrolase